MGTGTGFPKVCYIDENGKLTGFDVELIKEIDNRLPEYEFELQTMDFSNLLLSLETKKIDLVAHVMEKSGAGAEVFFLTKKLTPTGETALWWLRTMSRSIRWMI